MKVTNDNLNMLPEKERDLAKALLTDILEINNWSHVGGHGADKDVWLDWQDYHDEYSPERTDPCPDYYGYYAIMQKSKDGLEVICDKMPLKDIDWLVCGLLDYAHGLFG